MSVPSWMPTDIDGCDDAAQLALTNRAICLVLAQGQQNQLRGNLLIRAQLRDLNKTKAQLEARISAAKGPAYNLVRPVRHHPVCHR